MNTAGDGIQDKQFLWQESCDLIVAWAARYDTTLGLWQSSGSVSYYTVTVHHFRVTGESLL